MTLIDLDDDRHFYIHDDGDNENYGVWVIKRDATVDAVPVSYIQQRIDRLRLLAEYEAEANGGYTGQVHTEVYALRRLINYWKAEQSAKDK